MRFLKLDVYRHTMGDTTRKGVSSEHDAIYIEHEQGNHKPLSVPLALRFSVRVVDGRHIATPTIDERSYQFGGNLAYTSDSRASAVYHLFDRCEAPAPHVVEVAEGYVCQECALMIANGETTPDVSQEEEKRIAIASAGWSLDSSENEDMHHEDRTCETCAEDRYGSFFYAVKLRKVLPAHAFPGGYEIIYLKGGHTPLCPTCATKEGLTESDGHSGEGSQGCNCDECDAVIVEDQNTHHCEECDQWVNPDECLTVGPDGYRHECTSCKAVLEGVAS